MYLTEYQRATVDNFMGLWNRGSLDDIPPDHASDIQNMAFARKREVMTRPAASYSRQFPATNSPVVRMFLAAFGNDLLIPIALDNAGNIFRLDGVSPVLLLNIPNMVDFTALNMGNAVYIAPMVNYAITDPRWNFSVNVIWVWSNPAFPLRPAAGPAPANAPFELIPDGTGNVGPGYYAVSTCLVYDTGYVTPPSPRQITYMPGGTEMIVDGVSNIPNPPSGVVGYIILVTQGQATYQAAQVAALYEYGTIYDLTLASPVINFFDTDLVILATNDPANGNLLNSMGRLACGSGYGSIGLIKYHGRMVIIGPMIGYDQNGNPLRDSNGNIAPFEDGRVFVSFSGAQENFDDNVGFLVVDSEFDGNIPRTGFELFGVLYICKAVGTFSTTDTGSAPNDPTTPWVVNVVDGGIGAYHNAIGTITGSQPGLSFNSTAFLANRNGLFLFNGNVLRPELSWKIRGLWMQMTVGQEPQIRVAVDIYNDIFYCLVPLGNPPNPSTLTLLMADYSLGLDSNNIRWSVYAFPWPVYDIMMASFPYDPVPPPGTAQNYYFLRLGSIGNIYRLDGAQTYDVTYSNNTQVATTPIFNWYQLAPMILGDPEAGGGVGALNICRFIRYRMSGNGNLTTFVANQSNGQALQLINVSPLMTPDNYADIGIQTNFTNEKAIVKFQMNDYNDFVKMARVDIFGKTRWPTRPNG